MKVKKTIAGICALAMLGTCGMTAFAEEVTTTTTETPAETTVTTVETTEASVAMTEGTTDTSVTTEVTTEENVIAKDTEVDVKVLDTYELDLSGHHLTLKACQFDISDEDIINKSAVVWLEVDIDGQKIEKSFQLCNGLMNFSGKASNYINIKNNSLHIFHKMGVNVIEYRDDILTIDGVSYSSITTTITNFTDETITTTTVSSVTKEELYNIFVSYVSDKIKATGDDFYKAEDIITSFDFDKSAGVAYGTYTVEGTDWSASSLRGGYCKITKDGVTELTTQYTKDAYIKETIRFDYAGNKFVAMLTKPEYASQGDNDYLISIYNITSGEAVATNLYRVKTGAVVVGGNNVKPLSSYLTVSDYVTLMGVSYTYDKASNKFVPVENNSNNNSSSSSTTSKKNPAGTGNSPKTGDNTVLPVVLALTFVAGTAVVASVKRFKK